MTIVKKATRDGFGKALLELGEKDSNVWAVTADVSESTRTHWFAEKFPDRFVQVGVAEQNMAGVAAGIASCGKMAFISAFAAFSPGRNFDQIRVSLCYNDLNVKIHGSHAGASVGPDGASHQILEDIALMRALPNMVVVVPADVDEAHQATLAVAQLKGPAYIRTSRENSPVFTKDMGSVFHLGKANVLVEDGDDIVIFACGLQVYEAMEAAKALKQQNINCTVVNIHTIKPIDVETIVKYAKKCGLVLTVEDHQIEGGLGGAVAEVLCEHCPTPMKRVGMRSQFAESGNCSELYKKYGLDAVGIQKGVIEAMKLKR